MRSLSRMLASLALISVLLVACGPAPSAAPAQPAKPAAEAAQRPAPKVESKPAAPAAPAAQPAQPAKPAAAPAQKPAPTASAKETRRVVLGTTDLKSSYGIYTAAVAKLINERVPGVNVTVSEYGGAVNNLRRARAGEVDLSMSDQLNLYMAAQGILKGWETSPQTDVRLLWLFDPNANAWVVSERAGVALVTDLTGKAFSPGGQGTTTEAVSPMILDALGIKPQLYRGSMNDMAEAFKDRRIVGFVKATSLKRPDPVIQDAMLAQPIRVLSWPAGLVQKAQEKHPFMKMTAIPAGVYKADWNKEAISTWGSAIGMWAPARLPEDLAYQFTKAAFQDKDVQVAAFPALAEFDLGKLTVEEAVVPLHQGAVKAFREAGYQVPKALLPPEGQ